MTVGGVLGEAWGLYTRFFRRFFIVAVVVFLVVNLVNAALGSAVGSKASVALLVALITTVVSLVGTFWVQGRWCTRSTTFATGGSTPPSSNCSSASGLTSGR